MDYEFLLTVGISRATVATIFMTKSIDKLSHSLQRDAVINATFRKHFGSVGQTFLVKESEGAGTRK